MFSLLPIENDLADQAVWAGEEFLGAKDPFKTPDDKEIQDLRDQLDERTYVDQARKDKLENIVYQIQLERAAENGTIDIERNGEARTVRFRKGPDGGYQYWDSAQRKFVDVPITVGDDFEELFGSQTDVGNSQDQASDLENSYMKGVLGSIDGESRQDEVVKRRAEENADGADSDGVTAQEKSEKKMEDAQKAVDQNVDDWVGDAPEPKNDDGWGPF